MIRLPLHLLATTVAAACISSFGCIVTNGDDDDGNPSVDTTASAATTESSGPGTTSGDASDTSQTGADGSTGSGGAVDDTGSVDESTAAEPPQYPDYAGEGTLRLVADGDDLSAHDSVAADLNATESNVEVGARRIAAYFDDSGNRVVLRFPAEAAGEYEITEVDGGGAVVDVLLNTDATGLTDRIEGVLSQGTIRLDEFDTRTGRVRAVWVGVMTPSSASGLTADLAVAGALDVTATLLP